MNKPEEGEAPYQFWIKKLDLKTYTPSDFRKYLTEAGFADVNINAEGRSRICVSARAEKQALPAGLSAGGRPIKAGGRESSPPRAAE
jgi:hypothetical protein